MGHKINPRGFRLGINATAQSKWYGGRKDFSKYIAEDRKIRAFLNEKLEGAGISQIEIERAASRVKVTIDTARPGVVIGKKGRESEDLRAAIKALVGKDVSLNIVENKKPDCDARLVAASIASQLERRISCKRAMKDAAQKAMRGGAEGIKVICSGRINGADIARQEKVMDGRIPLHTLRAKIDYGTAEAKTTYGLVGIKVIIFKGLKYEKVEIAPAPAAEVVA